MTGNPDPNFKMLPNFQTLTLILSLFFSSASSFPLSPSPSAAPSPSPSPSPSPTSEPAGNGVFLTCPFDKADCHVTIPHVPHTRRGASLEELNFGRKLGIVFAAAAVLLQVVFGAFLVYKRVQLERIHLKGNY